MSKNDNVKKMLLSGDLIDFYQNAEAVNTDLNEMIKNSPFAEKVIIFANNNRFYRFSGQLNNTSIKRLQALIRSNEIEQHIQISLDGERYIGYTIAILDEFDKPCGQIVMLISEKEILQLFVRVEGNEKLKILLGAADTIITSNQLELQGMSIAEFENSQTHVLRKSIGFTPFELIISYTETDKNLNLFFILALIILILMLLIAFWFFVSAWRKNFFIPIQKVITEVESIDGTANSCLPLTGYDYLDGLICRINDMISRIEIKERELYKATLSLHEAEIVKQRSLIISLKKQISAHFTINVLNIIKALSNQGENGKAGLLCDGLSSLYRYANEGDSYINGLEEFFILRKYIGIMEIRYPNRFSVEIDMEDYLEDIKLPRMLLQPIIENSIVHGFNSNKAVSDVLGIIHIYSCLQGKTIDIVVEDNGCGMDSDTLNRLRTSIENVSIKENFEVEGLSHVALINIQRRIISYFGDAYGLQIESAENIGTRVTVSLPIL
ncbi:sensor histidine kinase [Anaerovorax sp. IOR16]|uniref:sensor histidine kinase n=1 Tax=Anaerovorax sp. IOR16 TaxID=2773458 RepID=UPI0019D18A90|nr:histidine kinase [Anaerovorax sp. IOR16]